MTVCLCVQWCASVSKELNSCDLEDTLKNNFGPTRWEMRVLSNASIKCYCLIIMFPVSAYCCV